MAKNLLTKIKRRFYDDSANAMANDSGLSAVRLSNYLRGRPVKDFMIAKFLRKFSRRYLPNGLSDTEVVDLLLKDYTIEDIDRHVEKG